MASETPRSSTRVGKSIYKKSISSFPESPLGATPRPDLRQHYPAPPPSVDLQSTYSHKEFSATYVDTSNNDSNFTQLRKKTSEHTQISEWFVDHRELKPEGSTRKALLILTLIFLIALVALGVVYTRSQLQ